MKVIKGKQYLCKQDVIMDDGELAYIKGRVYMSENDGCITDEEGDSEHEWHSDSEHELRSEYDYRFEDYFEEISTCTIDWEQRRFELVKAITQGCLSNAVSVPTIRKEREIFSKVVLEIADAVLEKYKQSNNEQ